MNKQTIGMCDSCKRISWVQKIRVAILGANREYCGHCMPKPRERAVDYEALLTV